MSIIYGIVCVRKPVDRKPNVLMQEEIKFIITYLLVKAHFLSLQKQNPQYDFQDQQWRT